MSDRAEGAAYLLIGLCLSPSVPAAVYLTVRPFWLAAGLVFGIIIFATVWAVAFTSLWAIGEGYQKVTA